MKKCLLNGSKIHAAWITSGGYFGGQQRREREVSLAASGLGLSPENYHLLRFPDLGLVASLNQAIVALCAIVNDFNPDTIFVTAFEGGHPDHDAANFMVYEAVFRTRMKCCIFEFPLYNGSGSLLTWRWRINSFPPGGPEVNFQPLDDMEIDCKHNSMKIYSSQWMYMIPARLATSRNSLKTRGEPYRRCPLSRDHCASPHRGRLNYERWFNSFMRIKFGDYSKAVKEVRTFSPLNGVLMT